MKIGVSVPFDFFTENIESEAAVILKKDVGDFRSFLPQLRTLAVDCIELRGVKPCVDKETIANISNMLWKLGFAISIHTSLPENGCTNAREFLSFLENILSGMQSFQKDLILVVHSYRGPENSYNTSLNRSAAAVSAIAGYIDDNNLPLKIALELNRGNPKSDPSANYEGLLELRSHIGNTDTVGFCWDFGHAYSNCLKNFIPATAPEEFVNQVIHTHIHGVSKNDETHCSLSPDNLPLGTFIAQLNKAAYKGILDLEINPQQMLKTSGAAISIKNSLNYLKSYL